MNSSMGNSNEWMLFYEQPVDDATMVTTSTVSSESNLSHLTPKGCSSKPIRRRSRASKKKPTTLLNANATNFRALVQQFTGCPATTHLSTNGRGSINLSFAIGNEHNQSGTTTISTMNDGCYYQHSRHENASYQQQQQQQYAISFDNVDDQILDEFDLDNISLQAFNMDFPYSNENANDVN